MNDQHVNDQHMNDPNTNDPHLYDYVVVGGGTAGSVIASRLTEDPDISVAVIEGGPSDVGRDDVLTLRRWMGLLGGELDYDYPTTEQPRGNSHIRHSRARVLGGCSSHNTLIAFKPLPSDWDEWAEAGADGWDAAAMDPYFARLRNNIVPVGEADRNAIARDFVDAAQTALGVPRIEGFNKRPFDEGVGFFDLAYHPENNKRSSASVAYLHPFLDRPNLHIALETWAFRLELDGTRATGVHIRTKEGAEHVVRARREVLVCAGAVDTPACCCTPASGRAPTWRSSASPSCTTCRESARTCSTTPSRSSCGRRTGRSRRTPRWTPTPDCSSAGTRGPRART